jgi:hypothetical protein
MVKLAPLILLSLVLNIGVINAQKSAQRDWEFGVTGGICWYNGDLNPNKFFGKNYYNQAFGVSIRKSLNQRFALRGQFNFGTLSAEDETSTSRFQQNRNLNFTTPIYELASTIEFNFLDYDALLNGKHFSPYSFIGLSVFRFNPSTEVEGNSYELQPLATESKSYSKTSVSIPFGFGFKWAITDRIIANADWGMRRSFSDYIDDTSEMYPLSGELEGLSENLSDRSLEQSGPDGTNWGTQRGNSQTKDWYSFVTAGLSIRIGPKKGSCKHIGI